MKLLEEYEPGVVHAWGLGQMLRQFGVTDDRGNNGGRVNGFSLTVLSLASDPGALALGPQLAAFAAAQGKPTALVVGPQQDVDVIATLRTACAATSQSASRARRPLQLVVSDDGRLGQTARRRSSLSSRLSTAALRACLARSGRPRRFSGSRPGAATAEQLARAATAAAADGREIAGILVADPEPGDQTTGRIPHLAAAVRRQMPTRDNDVPTESRR